MSHGRQRGGRWGMNFISASGPHSSLSHSKLQDDRPGDYFRSGYSSSALAADGVRGVGAAVPPPSSLSRSSRGYSDPNEAAAKQLSMVPGHGSSSSSRTFANLGRKRIADDEDYFLEEDDSACLEYQPAPGSLNAGKVNQADSEDSDDPLDRYMENIEEEVRSLDTSKPGTKTPPKGSARGIRDDIEQEDEVESYMRFMEENPHLGLAADEDEEVYEYDADGNIIGAEKKMIDPLPPIDHSTINYSPFAKNFYVEHEDISKLDDTKVAELREKLGIRVSGPSPLRPVCAFAHLRFDEPLLEAIRKAGFTKPTPIQAQAVPLAMAGRDVIGIGKTGSGKTAAFLWPAIIHIMDQPPLKLGDGPICVICAPTRELAQQIYSEAKKLARVYNLSVVCAYGGGSLWEQQKACEAGCEILICTPGRLIDLVKKKSTNLRRVTYLVFDEADKMFNLGFEPQVRSIANHVRPDRQMLLFSATFKRRLECLARDILTDPVRIIEGHLGDANEDITQIVEVFDKVEQKWDWLTLNLVRLTTEGSVLIFVTRKAHSEEVARKLKMRDLNVLLIHGDMHQSERNSVIQSFKRQEAPILVATDVASRGLDIPSIHNVINYEVACDIDTHTHRVGRTGRAGMKGTAYTLFVAGKDPVEFAACLVQHLESAGQTITPRLLDIANKCTWFAHNRSSLARAGGAADANIRPCSGFEPRPPRARPGLGLSADDDGFTTNNSNPRSGPATAAAAGEGADLIRPGGLQADRFSAMKSAFAAQYHRRFVSAGIEATKYTHPEMLKAGVQPAGNVACTPNQMSDQFAQPTPLPRSTTAAPLLPVAAPTPVPAPIPAPLPVPPPQAKPEETKKKRSRWD
ncbi:DEAD box ATP-dependent RNA helicase [Paragonimus heterotremus]|uniref:RNA helicase n=1 Tax=Paragonimus heterotremus TaxID=100268 RepID=A0A8J4TDH0_9TREM|nr:DEAD box ATP-dependent RNA helicase [Paragonimus heterotremus]